MTKPSKFGEGHGKFAQFGQGVRLPERAPDSIITIADFSGGYNSSKGREGAPPNASPDAIDFEVNRKNRLVRMAGTSELETFIATRIPYQMVTQVGLNGVFELVMFDAPYIGVHQHNNTYWTDVGLVPANRPFAVGQFGETLYFSNLIGPAFKRDPGQNPVAVPAVPAAMSYATFAARFYAGGTTIDGDFQPMGLRWSGASNDPEDFDGDGSGAELLIADVSNGDAIVAVRSMNLDLIAAVCRSSIWVGRRTGDPFRPAAFEPRVSGLGGLTDRTVHSTPLGVAFLSDQGLQVFDGNQCQIISEAINAELLPLNKDRINEYRVVYDPLKNRIDILTPVCRWVLDVEFGRWYRSSIVATDAAIYITESPGTTWDGLLTQQWAQLSSKSWRDLGELTSTNPDRHFLKYRGAGLSSQRAKEDPNSTGQFGVQMLSRWQTSRQIGQELRSLQTVKRIELEYSGTGQVEFWLPERDGQLELATAVKLYNSTRLRSRNIPLTHTGRGVALEIRARSGNPTISSIQLVAEPRSTLITITETSEDSIPPAPPQYLDPVDHGFTRLSKGVVVEMFRYDVGRLYYATAGAPVMPRLKTIYVQGTANAPSAGQSSNGPAISTAETFLVPGTDQANIPLSYFFSDFGFNDIIIPAGLGAVGSLGGVNGGGYTGRIEIFGNRIRFWIYGVLNSDTIVAARPADERYVAGSIIRPSGNPTEGILGVKKNASTSLRVMTRFDQEIIGGPPNGSVRVTVTGQAAFVVNLNAAGYAVIPIPNAVIWPASVLYEFFSAPAAGGIQRASLAIPEAWGGDTLGYVPLLDAS